MVEAILPSRLESRGRVAVPNLEGFNVKYLFLIGAFTASWASGGCSGLLGSTQKGPGSTCSPCEQLPAVADATGPFAQAAAAAAKGGQEASNQPQQQDPARINPNVLASSGAGAATWNKADTETRSQAGAPSVNQGLVIPTAADARAGGGVSPVVAGLQVYVDRLTALLEAEAAKPMGERDPAAIQRYQEQIASAFQSMLAAQAGSQAQTVNTYNLQGAVVTQSVANGSASGDGQMAVDPANARALAEGLPRVVEAAGAAKAAGVASPNQPGDVPPPAEGQPK